MVFGDKLPSDILATSTLSALLLTSDNGRSPIFGLIHFSRQPFHNSNVACAIGLRLRRWMWSSHHFACSRNVTPWACLTILLKCSSVSAPLPRRFHGRGVPFQIWTDGQGRRSGISWLAYAFSLPALPQPSTNERPTIYHLLRHSRPDQFGGTYTFLSASPVSRERR